MTSGIHQETEGFCIGGVVILQERSALLQLRDNKPGLNAAGLWVFPGGHCEPGEDLESCARREVLEETGYHCRQLQWLVSFAYRPPETAEPYQMNFFWELYDHLQPVHCYEGQEVRFVDRLDMVGRPMPPYLPEVWDKALAAAGAGKAPG